MSSSRRSPPFFHLALELFPLICLRRYNPLITMCENLDLAFSTSRRRGERARSIHCPRRHHVWHCRREAHGGLLCLYTSTTTGWCHRGLNVLSSALEADSPTLHDELFGVVARGHDRGYKGVGYLPRLSNHGDYVRSSPLGCHRRNGFPR